MSLPYAYFLLKNYAILLIFKKLFFQHFVRFVLFMESFLCRTYTFNDRRYGHYQPDGYGSQYPGQKQAGQYPAGVPLGEDKFKYDPVSVEKKRFFFLKLFR